MRLQWAGFFLEAYLTLAAAMYFDLGEQEERCIIEEIPEGMLVTGEFWREDMNDPKTMDRGPQKNE